jgi:hypothetical protein
LEKSRASINVFTETGKHIIKQINNSVFKVKSTIESIQKMENASKDSRDTSIPLEVQLELLDELNAQLIVYQRDGKIALRNTVEKLIQLHENKVHVFCDMLVEFSKVSNEKNPYTKDLLQFCGNYNSQPNTIPEKILKKTNECLFVYMWDYKRLADNDLENQEVEIKD